MKNINLLPEDLKPNSYAKRVNFFLKKLSIVFLVFLICIFLLGGFFYAFLVYQNRLLYSKIQNLRSEVVALEYVEQRVFLIKDRLSKISNILSFRNFYTVKENFQNILNQIGQDLQITRFELKANEINLEVNFRDIAESEKFVTYLKKSGGYMAIILREYDSNLDSFGYKASYTLIMK
ncbi:MAG: hypothetical protein N2558_01165 [Patescibacteria group bacterium]|nr:hypothetical protein [Patescibacteria group bacterium]